MIELSSLDSSTMLLMGLAGLLSLVALGLGGSVLLTMGETRRAGQALARGLLSLFWAVPVVLVVALVVVRAAPYFQNETRQAPAIRDELDVELGEPAEAGEWSAGSNAQSSSENEKASSSSGSRPDWTRRQRTETDAATLLVVRSGQYATLEEARDDAFNQAAKAVKDEFHRRYVGQSDWTVPRDLIQSRLVANRHTETLRRQSGDVSFQVHRVYWQLRLSPALWEQLAESWREQIVARRLKILAALGGLITLILATTATYLRVDAKLQGAYRGRLKWAAVSLIVAGGIVTALILPFG